MKLDNILKNYNTKECNLPYGIQNAHIYLSNNRFLDSLGNLRVISGAGSSYSDENRGKFLSIMECIERTANCENQSKEILSTFRELGDSAIDPMELPICDQSEGSSLNKVSLDKPLRFIESWNLSSQKSVFLPKEFINLYTFNEYPGENLTNPISTGMSLHDNYCKAIIGGILECIERDSISLTWLLRKKLPILENKKHNLNYENNIFDNEFLGNVTIMDATTDLGIPVFCMHATSNFNNKVKNSLMFSSELDPNKAIKKLKKELISVTYSLNQSKDQSEKNIAEFKNVDEGASYMASVEQDKEFDFLNSTQDLSLVENFDKEFKNDKEVLDYLIETLKEKGHTIYVTDLTNSECDSLGVKAVKVNIPSLQPLSFVHKSRFLGTKRIINYSKKLYGEYDVSKINNNPIAFS